MSEKDASINEGCASESKKRKLEISRAHEEIKKIKLNTSLGLSLLQAYDEEEQYSDDENIANANKTENQSKEGTANDSIIANSNLSSFIVEEEEISLSSSDVEKTKFDEETTDQLNIVGYDREDSTNLKNSGITSDGQDKTVSESLEENSNEIVKNVSTCDNFSAKIDILLKQDVEVNDVKNTSETIRLDHKFSVFGKEENLIDSNENDLKPVKKVKLNRSKFVRSTDECSNEKICPTKNNSLVVDQRVCNFETIISKSEKPAERDTTNSVVSNSILAEVIPESKEKMLEVNEVRQSSNEATSHSFEEVSLVGRETCFAQDTRVSVQNDETTELSEQKDNVPASIVLEGNIDGESLNVQLETSDEREVESKRDPTINIASESVFVVKNFGSNPAEITSTRDKYGIKKDGNEKNNVIQNEGKIVEKLDENESEKTVSSNFDKEVLIPNDLKVSVEPDEESQAMKDKKLNNQTEAKGFTDEKLREDKTVELTNSEITKKDSESMNKCDHITSDEEVFEDAVETIEETPKRASRGESEDCVASSTSTNGELNEEIADFERTEISKLEQALTGRLDNFQSHGKKVGKQTFIQTERSEKESKPFAEEAKRNIKLHLSLQGDRVSIKNASLLSEKPSLPPVRVKRQYRKREKVPGELEAKQASAKEYANRLRQRAERETPGAKKRGRKKKNQSSTPAEMILDSESNSNSIDTPEKDVFPLTVAINRFPSRKSNVAGKVQPIKLKISKNANVTIECTSKYDTCSADEKNNKDNVNEKIVGILQEARKRDGGLSPNIAENRSNPWSGPDLQRVERLLKESNITITPVASGQEVSPPPVSILKPIFNPKEKSNLETSSANVESKTAACIMSVNERDDGSENMTSSSNADKDTVVQEELMPWKIVKSPLAESNSCAGTCSVTVSKPVDVKSEIRRKIASVEKLKLDVGTPANEEIRRKIASVEKLKLDVGTPANEQVYVPTPKIETTVADLPFFSTDARLPEATDTKKLVQQICVETDANEQMTPEPSSVSISAMLTTPPSAMVTLSKLPNLPAELFPKKRGRPTKAMVAAREAYRKQQDEIEKLKQEQTPTRGEADVPSDSGVNTTSTTEPIKIVKRGRKPKHERLEKKDSDDLSYDESPFDPAREAQEQRRVEEERIKKEEERERKNEIRRLKAKERSDLVKEKRLRQKMKAKERHKLAKELRRLQQEEKKKLEEQLKRLPVSMGFDDDTRMSAENSQAANMSFSIGMADDDSSGATNDLSQKLKKSRMEVTDSDSKDLMVDQIAEYQWPIQGGDLYMIQEQVSNFLGVKSFKRKYPDIWRRPVDSEERAYLVDSGLVSETLCDLGITAVRSAEVLDIMCSDFPEKYEEFRRYMRDKQMKELSFKQRAWANGLGYKLLMADGSKQDMKKRAMESVSNWNSALNKSRAEDRRSHMDLQTFIIHYPKQKGAKMTVPSPKVGSYPVTILPGQFCDYYKEYTPTELRYMPVNTVLYGPLKHPSAGQNGDANQSDSDDSSSSDDSSTTSEDTQATEETLEDIYKDICRDENNVKIEAKDSSFFGDEEQILREANNDPLSGNDRSKVICKVCLGDQNHNKLGLPEVLISCSQCASTNHPTCLDLSLNIVSRIRSYEWQCPDCKICAQCKENADEDKMLFCDTCDRGFHIYCVGLIKVPAGNWQCKECRECALPKMENNMNTNQVSIPKESHPSQLIEMIN